ncbi:MAG: (2Fe-2S) ferredoxin domain-containing protein [Pseudomonadota bacterium]
MTRITVDDLKQIKKKASGTTTLRSGKAPATITVHMGTCGIAAGARDVMRTFLEEKAATGKDDINIVAADCAGQCKGEPMITVTVRGAAPVVYCNLDPDKAKRIFHRHLIDGDVLTEYISKNPV